MRPNATIGAPDYPSPTGGSGKPDGKTDDEVFYRCAQCGFLCRDSEVASPGGTDDGDGGVTVTVTDGVGDPTVNQGFCHFCGSPNSFKG